MEHVPTPPPEPPAVPRPQPVVPTDPRTALPYTGLRAPRPAPAEPPVGARLLAFIGIVVGGLLGGLIGWGTGDLLVPGSAWPAVGALVGALVGASGVGIIAALVLRAMNEWHAVRHPEAG